MILSDRILLTSDTMVEEDIIYDNDSSIIDIIANEHYSSTFDSLISEYINSYYNSVHSISSINVDELYDLYSGIKQKLHYIAEIAAGGRDDDIKYTEESLSTSGFIKSTFVIHEHDSKKAPLHWDLRFKTEFKTSAYSFVLLKHRFPGNNTEKLLCKRQAMHPPVWVDLDHTDIATGYGAGSIKTIDRGTIYYKEKEDDSFVMYLMGRHYIGAYHMISISGSNYLFFRATKSILPAPEERTREWVSYATNFIEYLNERFSRSYTKRKGAKDLPYLSYKPYNYIATNYDSSLEESLSVNNHMIVIPSIEHTIALKKDDRVDHMKSNDCNINSIEDIMRLLITREYARKFITYDLTTEDRSNLLNTIKKIDYNDRELSKRFPIIIKDREDNEEYLMEKAVRAVADIYMGHKFYGALDLEKILSHSLFNRTYNDSYNMIQINNNSKERYNAPKDSH